jgi:DNA-binding NarL/FixJ family response regulator
MKKSLSPAGPSSPAEVSRTATVVGRRVLLIESQEVTRVHVYNLMHEAGLRVDAAAGIEQARDALRDSTPELVVTGLPADDASFGILIGDIRALQPLLRVVQLVDDDDAFSFSKPDSGRPAQVARHNLDRTLVEAIAEELDTA